MIWQIEEERTKSIRASFNNEINANYFLSLLKINNPDIIFNIKQLQCHVYDNFIDACKDFNFFDSNFEFKDWENVPSTRNWVKKVDGLRGDIDYILLCKYANLDGWSICFCGITNYSLQKKFEEIFNLEQFKTVSDINEVKSKVDKMIEFLKSK